MAGKIFRRITDFAVIALGSAIFAAAVGLILEPYGIVPGGVTGISMLISHIFPVLPISILILVINAPLLIVSFRMLGVRFLVYSGFGTAVSAVMIDVFPMILPTLETEPLLAGIYGGLLSGAGLGLVFIKGATTGGSDIVARLLKIPFPGMNIGRLIMIFDGCVVLMTGIVFGSINNMLYTVITLFISTQVIDGILYGLNVERLVFIISEHIPQIVDAISQKLGRGATLLHGEGTYTGKERKIILCAVKRQQIAALKNLIKDTDPNAFMIVTEANEVLGEGFGDYGRAL